MSGFDIITFTTDFGWAGGYVSVCEGIVARVRPEARVFHISHEVPVGDIDAGALTLARVTPSFPPAVHLALVDPGVGTDRRPLALTTARGDLLVGPDNGLLLPAAEALGGLSTAWCLDASLVRTKAGLAAAQVSSTFHGRDVFAPAAALLSGETGPPAIASPIDPAALVRLVPAFNEVTPEEAVSQVIEIDRFGNVGLALRFADLVPREGQEVGQEARFLVEIVGEDVPEWTARVVRTFAELGSGELGVYRDSWDQVALAVKAASAAELLSLTRGMKVRLTVLSEPPSPPSPLSEGLPT
jgi:S-adenosylmethionine hydrolase